MHCNHNWKDLYINPGDSGFKQVYDAQQLNLYKLCETCGAVGKQKENRIVPFPPSKWEGHKTQASTWQKNLETFAIALEQN